VERIFSIERSRFTAGDSLQIIWTRPTLTSDFFDIVTHAFREQIENQKMRIDQSTIERQKIGFKELAQNDLADCHERITKSALDATLKPDVRIPKTFIPRHWSP
jgi:hypothetical protein